MSLPFDQIICTDCIEGMKEIENNTVDLILTDPPYNISSNIKVVMKNHPKQKRKKDRILTSDFGEWDHFDNEKDYIDFTKRWVAECYRILKDTGNFVSFYENLSLYILKKIWVSEGGAPRQPLYWIKKNPKPRLRKVDFQLSVESLFWGCKRDGGHVFNWNLGEQPNIVVSAVFLNNEITGHPTQKPTTVIEPWVKYLSNEGGIVLDPFCGSGTVCLVARKLNRHFIGFEINPEYCKIARRRLVNIPERLESFF